MSLFPSKGLAIRSSLRRKYWQQNSKKQHSFSLDVPKNMYDSSDSLNNKSLEILFDRPLRTRDEDRFFLYLPRNLSYCELCSDVIRDHVQKKVRLLSDRLCQYEDVPPTPVENETAPGFGDEDDGLWTKKCCSVDERNHDSDSEQQLRAPLSILKKRAVSFPAPRREGKKVVRFADALGLELESIRYLVRKDLHHLAPSGSTGSKAIPDNGTKKIQLYPAFLAPSLSIRFVHRLEKLKVSLHSVSTADSTVYGIISVLNLTFHKLVFVRYTVNSWLSYHDEVASYLDGSSTMNTDKFSFVLYCNPSDLYNEGHSLFFAVGYQTAEHETYWDNNDGKNYCIKCEVKHVPKVGNHSWVHFL